MKLTDWKGNEIKVGDTIVVVSTQPIFGASFIMFHDGSEIQITKEPPKYTWEAGEEYEVIGSDEYPMISTNMDGHSVMSPLSATIWMMDGSSDIICIKGVSDNEQDYYRWLFSNN